jgi:hypothetical protein
MSSQVIHETAHAEWENKGLTSYPFNTEEEQYVDGSLAEEANAFAKEYEFAQNSGLTPNMPKVMQDVYDEGYQEGELNLFKNNPNATDEELEAAGKAGARKELAGFLKDTKADDGESYGDIFRKNWQDAHPDGAGGGPSAII